jgi:hypothetical protein
VLTYAPVPSWSALWRALRSSAVDAGSATEPWASPIESAGWLSRSAWSLALVAQWRMLARPNVVPVVLVPDYFCNSTLAPLRALGARLCFYPVLASGEPDLAACRRLAADTPPDLCLLVHYFGRPVSAYPMRDLCRRHGTWLIEDAAHVLRAVSGIGAAGDFVVYSPHKLLALPDGAVLVARPDGPSALGAQGVEGFGAPQEWPSQLDDLARRMRARSDNDRSAIVWLTKRLLQRCGLAPRGPVASFDEPRVERGETDGDGDGEWGGFPAPRPSALARRLVASVAATLEVAARRRQRLQLLLDALVASDAAAPVRPGPRPAGREWTPYLATYDAGPDARRTYATWSDLGLPASSWPDMPPEAAADRPAHADAWSLRDERVYLALHQSLDSAALLRHAGVRTATATRDDPLTFAWEDVDAATWADWLDAADGGNLLQRYSYGEAKAATSGWRVRRGVFRDRGKPVAVAQALERRATPLLRLRRVNRGPVFLVPRTAELERRVVARLASMGCWWRGSVLSIAPELPLEGRILALLAAHGFRQFTPVATESIAVDLETDLGDLRRALDGKWRNMLSAAERSGLTIDDTQDETSFAWMLARYQELIRERHFTGPDVPLLTRLRERGGGDVTLDVLRAVNGDEAVGGICIARHGATATYLLGWNGPRGRALKANQLLLWNAIVRLKAHGVRSLDLGGISADDTPGITSFKTGINGRGYELVGEYWKW